MHVGNLGLLMEPVGAAIERLSLTDVPRVPSSCSIPTAARAPSPTTTAYRERIDVIARRADIVKASVEDLAYLYPGVPPAEAATALLGSGPSLVLVTDGPRPARAFLPGSVLAEAVPDVTVADTIGAGDAFGGGFLAWWTAHGLGQADLGRPAPPATRWSARRSAPPPRSPPSPAPARARTRPPCADLQARNWWPERERLRRESSSANDSR